MIEAKKKVEDGGTLEWFFKANDTTYFQEADILSGGSSASLSISGVQHGLFHFLIYLPNTLIDQGYQKIFGRGNDIGISLLTTSNGLSLNIQGNYRAGLWRYIFTNETYIVNGWNWVSVFRNGAETTDITPNSSNLAMKAWVNGVGLNNMTTATSGSQSSGNSSAEWNVFNFLHVDSGNNSANFISLKTFFGKISLNTSSSALSIINEIHSSIGSLPNVQNIYTPNSEIGFYTNGTDMVSYGSDVANPLANDVVIIDDAAGFITNALT
jgi:hypothetical protein